jgi:diacylglycerol kinase (ATP)
MKQNRNLTSFFGGFVDAAKGLGETIRTQFNIRMHFIITLIGIVLGFYFEITAVEWCIIILAIAVVWIAELFNTSIEYFSDFVSPEFNYLVGKVKDISAAAAFVAAISSITIGLIIFLPKIL